MDIQLTLWVKGVRFSVHVPDGLVNLGTSDLQVKDKDRILSPAIAAFKDYGLPVLLMNSTYASDGSVSYAIAGPCDLPKIQAEIEQMGESWDIKDGILLSPECSKVHHMALRRLLRGG